jgi:uncharacterized protein YktB (UPF0637 family)
VFPVGLWHERLRRVWLAVMYHDKGDHYEFTNLVKELETANTLFSDKVH